MGLRPEQDAFGQTLWQAHRTGQARELIERSDGLLTEADATRYFGGPRTWPPHERKLLRHARGRVLDIGCGAGRHSVWIQKRGCDVVSIDVSPGAVSLARELGVRDARCLSITEIRRDLGLFDTVVMLGNNLGLLASEKRARWLLRRMRGFTSSGAQILAGTRDPYVGSGEHRKYHRHNRARGRMGGQIRIRIRHGGYCTPWFDYLFLSRRELERLIRETGWRVDRIYDGPGAQYGARLVRA